MMVSCLRSLAFASKVCYTALWKVGDRLGKHIRCLRTYWCWVERKRRGNTVKAGNNTLKRHSDALQSNCLTAGTSLWFEVARIKTYRYRGNDAGWNRCWTSKRYRVPKIRFIYHRWNRHDDGRGIWTMNKKYKVIYSPAAKDDLRDIARYIIYELRNPQAAKNITGKQGYTFFQKSYVILVYFLHK